MSLTSQIIDEFKELGKELFDDSIVYAEQYIKKAPHDPITGEPTGSETSYPIRALIANIVNDNDDDDVVMHRITTLILQDELPIIPEQGDIIVDEKDERYNIDNWNEDEAHVTWEIWAHRE